MREFCTSGSVRGRSVMSVPTANGAIFPGNRARSQSIIIWSAAEDCFQLHFEEGSDD